MKYQRMSHKINKITRRLKRRLVIEVKKKKIQFEKEKAKNVKCRRAAKLLKGTECK